MIKKLFAAILLSCIVLVSYGQSVNLVAKDTWGTDSFQNVVSYNDLFYALDWRATLTIIDPSKVGQEQVIKKINLPEVLSKPYYSITSFSLYKNYLKVIAQGSASYYDISTPLAPNFVGKVAVGSDNSNFVVLGDADVYVRENTLRAIKINDNGSIEEIINAPLQELGSTISDNWQYTRKQLLIDSETGHLIFIAGHDTYSEEALMHYVLRLDINEMHEVKLIEEHKFVANLGSNTYLTDQVFVQTDEKSLKFYDLSESYRSELVTFELNHTPYYFIHKPASNELLVISYEALYLFDISDLKHPKLSDEIVFDADQRLGRVYAQLMNDSYLVRAGRGLAVYDFSTLSVTSAIHDEAGYFRDVEIVNETLLVPKSGEIDKLQIEGGKFKHKGKLESPVGSDAFVYDLAFIETSNELFVSGYYGNKFGLVDYSLDSEDAFHLGELNSSIFEDDTHIIVMASNDKYIVYDDYFNKTLYWYDHVAKTPPKAVKYQDQYFPEHEQYIKDIVGGVLVGDVFVAKVDIYNERSEEYLVTFSIKDGEPEFNAPKELLWIPKYSSELFSRGEQVFLIANKSNQLIEYKIADEGDLAYVRNTPITGGRESETKHFTSGLFIEDYLLAQTSETIELYAVPNNELTFLDEIDNTQVYYVGTSKFNSIQQMGNHVISVDHINHEISLIDVNHAPILLQSTFSIDEDTSLLLTEFAQDKDGDIVYFSEKESPENGVLNFSENNDSLVYIPDVDFFGEDSFVVQINDNNEGSGEVTISVTVNPINDTPIVEAFTLETNEDVTVTQSIIANDVEDEPLSYAISVAPTQGEATLSDLGELTYTANEHYFGEDGLTVEVSDTAGNVVSLVIPITIHSINDVPVTADVSHSTSHNGSSSGTIATADADGDSLSYSLIEDVSNGTLTLTSDGEYSYSPNSGFSGTDSFIFEVSDGTASMQGTITFTVATAPVVTQPKGSSSSGGGSMAWLTLLAIWCFAFRKQQKFS